MNAIPVKNIKIEKVELVEGEYEGYKYYKLRATTNKQMVLSCKLTAFEYETLLSQEKN